MNDIPDIAPDILANYTANQLIDLLATHEDRAPRALFDACVAQGDTMVATLVDYFRRMETMDPDDEAYDWWMNIHGFWLAGAIPGEAAGQLLLELLRRADQRDDFTLDWVAGYMPWLFANKPDATAVQAQALAEDRCVGWYARCEAVDAVVGMAHGRSQASLESALDWLAGLVSNPDEDEDLRGLGGSLLMDFPRPRHRAMLDRLAAEQEIEPKPGQIFNATDVEKAFARNSDKPRWFPRGTPWDFYDDAQITARQKRWREEEERAARQEEIAALNRLYPETYLRDMPKLGRNDPCHCGSGKKYKKCCLPADAIRMAAQRPSH